MILTNTIVLAMDEYPEKRERVETLESINDIMSMCFAAEMVIKLIGFGVAGYAKDNFNIFDAVIVVFSGIEMTLGWTSQQTFASNGALSAFRAIRLLRIFKLARSWKSFQDMLVKIGRSLKDISNFAVLLFIFITTYSILGMELYAQKIKIDRFGDIVPLSEFDPDMHWSPRSNFDNFHQAFTTIFIVLIGEDWQYVMYDCVRATDRG